MPGWHRIWLCAGLSQLQSGVASHAVCEVQPGTSSANEQLTAVGIDGGESVVLDLLEAWPAASAESGQSSAAHAVSHQADSGTPLEPGITPDPTVQHAADDEDRGVAARQQSPPPEVRSHLVPTVCTLEGLAGRRRWAVHPLARHTLGDLLRQPHAAESQILHDAGGRLLMYQLLSGLGELHSAAKWHGRLTPEHLPLTRDG